MKTSNRIVKFPVSIVATLALLTVSTSAQGTKGGVESSSFAVNSINSGSPSGISKFRETISSIQQRQQQLQPQVQEKDILQKNIIETTSQQIQPQVIEQISSFQKQQQQQQISTNLIQEQQQSSLFTSDAEPAVFGSVKGTPGVDFPALTSIPNTKFSCDGLPFVPGMYADESTGCQVYHLCFQGRKESFLCGVGTVFNQAILNCDFWHSVECSKSSQYYHLNADFGKGSPEPSQLQSVSKQSSFSSSSRQVIVPPPPPAQQQIIKFSSEQRLTELVRPPPPSVIQTKQIESSYNSFGDKISPPKVAIQSNSFNSFQSSFGGKASPPRESFGAASASSGQVRQQQGLLSPGRRIALQNQEFANNQQQSASEISTLVELQGNQSVRQTELPVGSALMVVNSVDESKTDQQQASSGQTKGSSKFSLSTANKIVVGGVSAQFAKSSVTGEDKGVWKPYFKSKASAPSKTSQNRNNSAARIEYSTTAATTGPAIVEAPSTNRPPNQEPTFSVVTVSSPVSDSPNFGSTLAPAIVEESPKVPRSSPPPAPPPTTPTEATTASATVGASRSPETTIESDIESTVTSTTSASPSSESSGTSAESSLPTSPAPAAGSTNDSNETPTTVSGSVTGGGLPTTTGGSEATADAGDNSRSKKKKKKKRKASLTASSVEYANNSTTITNSSRRR